MLLRVELHSELLNQRELRFEKIDVLFLVGGELLEQILRDAVIDRVAMSGRLEIERAGGNLGREIALDDFLDVAPDVQRVERLHVRLTVEEKDAGDQLIG